MWKQEDQEFKDILCYKASSKAAWDKHGDIHV